MPCGREGEGLHLPSVPEALNRACPDKYSAELYRPPRPYHGLSELRYLSTQCICTAPHRIIVSTVFARQNVGVKKVGDRIWLGRLLGRKWPSVIDGSRLDLRGERLLAVSFWRRASQRIVRTQLVCVQLFLEEEDDVDVPKDP